MQLAAAADRPGVGGVGVLDLEGDVALELLVEPVPQLPAVRDKRVHVLTEWYALLPGDHVGAMAEQYGLILHPFANLKPLGARPTTAPDVR